MKNIMILMIALSGSSAFANFNYQTEKNDDAIVISVFGGNYDQCISKRDLLIKNLKNANRVILSYDDLCANLAKDGTNTARVIILK